MTETENLNIKRVYLGLPVVQWLRLCLPNAWGGGSILLRELRRMPQDGKTKNIKQKQYITSSIKTFTKLF